MEGMNAVERAGALTKQGLKTRNWKRRFFLLIGDTLFYKKDPSGNTIGTILLEDAVVRPASCIRDRELCIEIFTPTRRWFLVATTPEDFEGWHRALHHKCQLFQSRGDGLSRWSGVLKEGEISKRGKVVTAYRKRWFILTDKLYYFTGEAEAVARGVITIQGAQITQTDEERQGGSFRIITEARTYYLLCRLPEECEEWMSVLQRVSEGRGTFVATIWRPAKAFPHQEDPDDLACSLPTHPH